jgi:hypothetical protein
VFRPTRNLAAEQLAQLGEVTGDRVLLPGEVVDLALGCDPGPFGLCLGLRQQLIGLGLGLGDDLIGVLLGVADELLAVLVSVATGLVRLGTGLRGALLRGGRALLGLGDELLRGGLCRRQPLGLLPLGLLTACGELDLELGLGLRPLGFALLQDAL